MTTTSDGIFTTVSNEQYHSDPTTLSSSGAKLLLPPSAPAKFKYLRDNPRTDTDAFRFGRIVHTLILEADKADFVVVDAPSWQYKAAKEAKAEAAESGVDVVLQYELEAAEAMRDSVLNHPAGRTIFTNGDPEISLYWTDQETGVRLRARPDWMTHSGLIGDLKTTRSADPQEFSRSVAKFNYPLQQAWYSTAVKELGIADDPSFVFVAVDKEPPYLVSVVELDDDAVQYGYRQMRRAIEVYAKCLENDEWPGYGDQIQTVGLPKWAYAQEEWT